MNGTPGERPDEAGGRAGNGQQQGRAQAPRVSSFTSVLTVCLVLLAAVVLSYIAGVMSGRNYTVKEHEKEMAQLLGSGKKQQSTGRDANLAGDKQGILKPEELEYSRLLRSAKDEKRLRQQRAANQGNVAQPGQAQPGKPDQSGQVDQGAMQPGGQGAAQALQQTPPIQQPPVTSGQVFDYVFQVASLKNEASVDSLREKLEGAGLRTRMEKRGRVYVVFVLLRGDEARASAVRETIAAISREKPLELARKVVKI